MVHSVPQIAEMMSYSLQRTMLNHSNLRPAVVEAALLLTTEGALQNKALQCSVLGQVKGLLNVWKQLLQDATHSHDRQDERCTLNSTRAHTQPPSYLRHACEICSTSLAADTQSHDD